MTARPRIRKKFRNPADEANYLNAMITWLYQHGEQAEALQLCDSFEKLLQSRGRDDGSIMLQDHWALLFEVKGDVGKAIRHREREIALIKRALKIGGPIGPIDYRFLSEKIAILAALYEQLGRRKRRPSPQAG